MVGALTAWLQRQTFNITYMDAPVVIPSKYPFQPETGTELPQILIKPGTVKTVGPVSPTGGLLPGASNPIPIQMGLSLYGRAQLAENPNDNEFDLDSFLNDDVETFSRSTTDSLADNDVWDDVILVDIADDPDDREDK